VLGEFNEAGKPKTSLTKYSIELNDFVVQTRPHRIPYLRLLGRPYTLLYARRSVLSAAYIENWASSLVYLTLAEIVILSRPVGNR